MHAARRLVTAGYAITGVPTLALFLLSATGAWEGGHDLRTIIVLQALGLCMAISAVTLAVGLFRSLAILHSSVDARTPMNAAWASIGLLGLLTILWMAWHLYG